MMTAMTSRIHALIDLDGTMFHGSERIEGAELLIQALQDWNIPYLFVTNNSSRTAQDVADLLNGMDIPARPQDVLTTAQAAAQYIKRKYGNKRVYMIGEKGLEQALNDEEIEWTNNLEEAYGEDIGVVVQGIDRSFSYAKLEAASSAVRRGAVFIATNPDLMLPSDRGLSPGSGSLSRAIEAVSGIQALYIGKPEPIIMEIALERLQCSPQDAVVIGDNMMTDMRAGARAGCQTALVLTGVTTSVNLASYKASSGVEPTVVCNNLAEMKDWIYKELTTS
ncbi:TIGR01457 family HAD-type hydrolase [Paenibacillus sp. 1001270B_150601_E10]|uniref:TIGR01457 family HAD-type hydrolase n=1 Tax=Paenibacillus sp. 1001270B_150601_E10 TaxID=2787079 RepID=UPI001E39794B|nr:TIGR01457 family HAD-type hydrolase [Paenibacillus sp. 1001270B_150601_E10]